MKHCPYSYWKVLSTTPWRTWLNLLPPPFSIYFSLLFSHLSCRGVALQGWPRLELVVRGADAHGRHQLAGAGSRCSKQRPGNGLFLVNGEWSEVAESHDVNNNYVILWGKCPKNDLLKQKMRLPESYGRSVLNCIRTQWWFQGFRFTKTCFQEMRW